jgi:UDP-2,3-diacylglucosamine pyrophosphatase LpxH
MNPVDHPHGMFSLYYYGPLLTNLQVVVTTNILVRRRRSQDTLYQVKKQVLLLHGELVYFVVHKRRRIRRWAEWISYASDLLALHQCIFRIGTKNTMKTSNMNGFCDVEQRILKPI